LQLLGFNLLIGFL